MAAAVTAVLFERAKASSVDFWQPFDCVVFVFCFVLKMPHQILAQLEDEKKMIEKLLRASGASSREVRSLVTSHLSAMKSHILRLPNDRGDLVLYWVRVTDKLSKLSAQPPESRPPKTFKFSPPGKENRSVFRRVEYHKTNGGGKISALDQVSIGHSRHAPYKDKRSSVPRSHSPGPSSTRSRSPGSSSTRSRSPGPSSTRSRSPGSSSTRSRSPGPSNKTRLPTLSFVNSAFICNFCKEEGHFEKECSVLREKKCYTCNGFGHLSKKCPSFKY